MKFKIYATFTALMLAAAITGAISPLLAWAAVFVVGATLSDRQRGYAFGSVAGYLSRANADTNDDVGEWQQGVLHRNAKGMNTGSTLFALMSRLGNENADSQTYNWFEKDPTRRVFYCDTVMTTSSTQIQFSNTTASGTYDSGTLDQTVGTLLKPGAIIENTVTNERMIVVAGSSSYSTPITVSRAARGYNGNATTAVVTALYQPFVLITLAKPNGSNPIESAFTQPSNYLNYIQTFNSTASVENAYKNGILRTDIDGPWMEQKADALERIANDINLAYYLGVAEVAGTTYRTGGVRNGIDKVTLTDNALAGGGSAGVSLDSLNTWFESFMTWGSDVKLAFCGPKAYSAISKFANSAQGGYRIMQGDNNNEFGLVLTTVQTPFGAIDLCTEPLFKTIPTFNGHMIVIDLELIKQKTFEPLFFEQYAPTPGSDTLQGQFRAKLGIKMKNPQAFGYATNFHKINA